MKLDQKVVDSIFRELLEDNSARYRQLLDKPANNDDDTYSRARNALAKLNEKDKEYVFAFIDLAIADSASVIFGTLDGTHFPDGIEDDFIVTYKSEEIQGSLQDIFIEKAEDKGVYK
ncbi:hypothetical protein VWW32_003063 [Cronobacter dublinensis]|uniref:hypothetical protein n=1 Tax=Cronobacter dublinensis TaxID=413497 RepID=UPI0024ACCC6E|nr:hypothetical protein [Cronobacter dublinensis]EMD9248482.1 hypothetical protein [Cronobacter dublinensis]MDI6447404.1 hypothetical protein [Cronobacter dublinensis]